MTEWVLLWLFLAPSENLETKIPFAAVKEVVLTSEGECELALAKQLNVNDTKYMISHGEGQLVCVQIPTDKELKWP